MTINAITPHIPPLDMAEKAKEQEPKIAEGNTMEDPKRFDTFEKSEGSKESDMTGIYRKPQDVQGYDKETSESKCTVNTDKVDAEIEQLQKEVQEIKQQLEREENENKRTELEQRLQTVESELNTKDNDNYRKQNASYTYA